jgi:hypothetical protein
VPDDRDHSWEDAAKLAAAWIWERSRIEGVQPCLVTSTLQNARGISSLKEIAEAGGQVTPRSKSQPDHRPVLAYLPNEDALKLALDLARGYSLAIVETIGFPIAEWAAGSGAIHRLDGSTCQGGLTD